MPHTLLFFSSYGWFHGPYDANRLCKSYAIFLSCEHVQEYDGGATQIPGSTYGVVSGI